MKPILFNTEMVKAILDGRKTQTRRVAFHQDKESMEYLLRLQKNKPNKVINGRYNKGDVLWVREKFCTGVNIREKQNIPLNEDIEVLYYVDETSSQNSNCRDFAEIIKWKPSIHMPKKYARIFLKVTNVRVERLEDITIEDTILEGYIGYMGCSSKQYSYESELHNIKSYQADEDVDKYTYKAFEWFQRVWNSTAKDGYKWEDNPYVFVYEFGRL